VYLGTYIEGGREVYMGVYRVEEEEDIFFHYYAVERGTLSKRHVLARQRIVHVMEILVYYLCASK